MKCPKCQAENAENAGSCSECGYELGGAKKDLSGKDKRFSGFTRTLTTELLRRQIELDMLTEFNSLVESRTYKPGDVILHRGEKSRDLLFLTEGLIEISTKEEDGHLILNVIEPPYIFGEIAFLFGTPRTATATAKTGVKAFLLKYENFMNLCKEFPEWASPLLTSFVTGIKTLHYKVIELEEKV